MHIVDMLVDATYNHVILTFMDSYSSYNQILVAKQDVHKTAF